MALASRWLERQRLAKVVPFLVPPVLDVGCGHCVAYPFAREGYVGIDLDVEPLREPGCPTERLLQGSAQQLPFGDSAFNTVLLLAVVEHLPDPMACLNESLRVLRPEGRIVITTPSVIGDQIHHLLAKIGVTSKHAAEEHQSIFSREALDALVRSTDASIVAHEMFLLGGNQVCVAAPKGTSSSLRAA